MNRKTNKVENTSVTGKETLENELLAEKEHRENTATLQNEDGVFKKFMNMFKEDGSDIDSSEHAENSDLNDTESKNLDDLIVNITSKCKFKDEYTKNNVLLSVNHLKQYFFFGKGPNRQKLKAVHDISFQVHNQEVFGIVGESGCGKTTTGRSIMRLYNITSGSIYYKGYRIGAGTRWNEKEIKFTRIRLKQFEKDIKNKIKNGEISEEEGLKQIADAKVKANNIIKVQQAKIKQIKYDDRHADNLRINDRDIQIHEEEVKLLKSEMDNRLKEIAHSNLTDLEAQNKSSEVTELFENKIKSINEKIKELKKNNHRVMREIQMIFQDPIDSLDPRMTVESIISEGLKIQGYHDKAENHKKVVEALERVGLIADYANRYPHEFSGGQRQRIGIARALIMNPKLLICDEPISALDVSIRAQIINLLNELKEEMGLTIIFIAHDLSVVKYFCDRIAVMYFGEIVELASSDELFKHPLHPYTKSLLSAIPKPNPLTEKNRQRIVYNPQAVHDYSIEKPKLVEILPGHFVLANTPEIEKYKEEIAKIDKNIK